MKQFSLEEERIRAEIRSIYNSGHCDKALEMSKEFLIQFPHSFLAKYSFAVMSGDYASDYRHSREEKERLLKIARTGISELFNSLELSEYPAKFQKSVKNEYYWFHKMPEEQYNLGLTELNHNPAGGHYSACVGASMMALKKTSERKLHEAEEWAQKSLFHFREFEKLSPTWYNINYFAAQSEACLGNYEAAVLIYKGMYHKQNSAINLEEIKKFEEHIEKIKNYR